MSAKLFNLPIKLSLEMIAKLFSATQIQKAQNYLIQGRVLEVTASSNNHDIEAYVEGSAAEPYRQEITLVNVNHKIVMRSHCTCPVRTNCKHVAAAMLALVDKKPVEEQRIHQWLRQLDEQKTVAEFEEEDEEKDRIIYVLSNDPHGIFVEFKRSKLNKKGQYNKGSKLALADIRYSMPWWIDPEDKQIISLLLSSNNHGSKIYIEGEISFLALTKMLTAEVCFWEENRIPLTWAKSVVPEFVWCEIDKKHTQMQMRMPGLDNWEFIATEPPLYVELDYLHLGRIETDLPVKKLSLLQHMPPVPLAQVDAISHKMLQHFSPKTVPVPSEIDFCEITDSLLTRLTFTRELIANNPILQPVIRVDHCYGEITFNASTKPERISLVKKNQVQYQVHRHVEQELAALQSLADLGLVTLEPDATLASSQQPYYVSVGLLPESIFEWSELTDNGLDALTALGMEIHFDDDFDLQITDAQLDVDLVDDDESGWFSLSLSADIDGQSVPLLALVARWLQQNGEPADDDELLLPGPNGGFIKIKAKTIKPLISIIQELFNRHSGDVISIPRNRAHILNDLSASDVRLLNGERVRNLAAKLAEFKGVVPVELPDGLNATLRDYQKQGFDWLCFLKEYQLGGILADDMGLGKTVQALAFLLKAKQDATERRTSLIVCPTSLVGNWLKEANKFAPSLNVVVIHGNKRQPLLDQINQFDVVVTTYPLMLRDEAIYCEYVFEHIILDEAQQIKNAQAKVTQVIKTLRGRFRLCLSGTPLENHLGELKSLMDFCLPGLLGQHTYFNKQFRGPIEKQADVEKSQLLSQRIAPFMLRRTKKEVVSELPEKTVIIQTLELERDQRNLYESIRLVMEKKLRELFAKKGVSSSHIEFLDALLKLRQACCDPRLVKLEQAQQVKDNAKMTWLIQNLPEMIEEGRKILIFSQFTGMLALIEDELKRLTISYSKLTGQTRDRQTQIDAFQEGDNSVFLISLKAGGTGLNLTAADTVIHFDPWWNPAAERQATDRAHRIGQLNPVFVYKLIAQGTVEEKIQEMQQHKQGLADSILSDGTQGPWQGSANDLLALLS
ncbi:DEAD/DEAH box helicase family protein [Shewanella sp. SG44-2]|uniref:DEAD/DEAH box helicase n=1 Tax=Shewanella sp. SG44-2 TaxID=2760962 RepID=UPI00160226B1|nr:DEAD/DEAH box helicase [Shewanella sp. SG44-2]MBB1426739.1 DEAD/DEAH box helicase family protein [Shewanella sp. SG44-2]